MSTINYANVQALGDEFDIPYNKLAAAIRGYLALQPSASAEPGWIDVNVRKPEKNIEVLIAFRDTPLPATGQYTASVHDTWGWSFPKENDPEDSGPITHWQPLPEHPSTAAPAPKSLLRAPLKSGERLVCYCPAGICQAPKGFSGPCNRAVAPPTLTAAREQEASATGVKDLRDAMWLDPECAAAGCCQSLKFKEASATGAEPDWKAEYYGAQEVLTKIRTALNASGRWALGESVFEAIDKLLATPTTSTTGKVDIEQMLRDCVPGGSSCDPQTIADDIRGWFAGKTSVAQEPIAHLKVGKYREWMLMRDLPEGEYRLALIGTTEAKKERDRIERNRDMWKGQCERQAATLESLRIAIKEHNDGCTSACNARRAAGKTSCPMLGYDRDCGDCPRDWLIEVDPIQSGD